MADLAAKLRLPSDRDMLLTLLFTLWTKIVLLEFTPFCSSFVYISQLVKTVTSMFVTLAKTQ